MRTRSLLLLGVALFSLAGCEKVVREANGPRPTPDSQPALVPVLDGVPVAMR